MTTTTDLEARLRELTPLQYAVTQNGDTERAFTGVYWDNHDDGTYRCIVCDEPLFRSRCFWLQSRQAGQQRRFA